MMYDSDEVRDTVRREMMTALLTPGAAVAPSALDRSAMDEARMAYAAAMQEALRACLGDLEARRREREEWMARVRAALDVMARTFVEWAQRIVDAFADTLRAAVDLATAAAQEVAEALGMMAKPEPEPFAWQRRPWRQEVRPAHGIDPVAAGRHPAVVMRTRIRGGRR